MDHSDPCSLYSVFRQSAAVFVSLPSVECPGLWRTQGRAGEARVLRLTGEVILKPLRLAFRARSSGG